MNTKLKLIGAALLALAILPAAVLLFHASLPHLLLALVAIGGTTVTYGSFEAQGAYGGGYTGGTTGPTLAQSAQVQAVVAQVAMSDTETTAVITHNLAISTAGLAALQPFIQYYLSTPGTIVPLISFALTSANVVTINKTTITTGTGGTYTVIIRRPYSASQ